MPAIITTPAQARHNISRFAEELESSVPLQGRLAYARAWYAIKGDGNQWVFGPSKFVGYQNPSAEAYMENYEDQDGRRTESQFQNYFRTVDPVVEGELHANLSSQLAIFLAKYGKHPSNKYRINVERARRRVLSPEYDQPDLATALVELMIAVAKVLPKQHYQRLRSEIAEIGAA